MSQREIELEGGECARVEDLLIDYVAGELPESLRVSVGRHLVRCGRCARARCELDLELESITWAEGEMPSLELEEALRSRVERRFRPPWHRRVLAAARRPLPAWGLVLAGAAPVLLWFFISAEPRTSQAPTIHQDARLEGYDASRHLGAHVVLF